MVLVHARRCLAHAFVMLCRAVLLCGEQKAAQARAAAEEKRREQEEARAAAAEERRRRQQEAQAARAEAAEAARRKQVCWHWDRAGLLCPQRVCMCICAVGHEGGSRRGHKPHALSGALLPIIIWAVSHFAAAVARGACCCG